MDAEQTGVRALALQIAQLNVQTAPRGGVDRVAQLGSGSGVLAPVFEKNDFQPNAVPFANLAPKLVHQRGGFADVRRGNRSRDDVESARGGAWGESGRFGRRRRVGRGGVYPESVFASRQEFAFNALGHAPPILAIEANQTLPLGVPAERRKPRASGFGVVVD